MTRYDQQILFTALAFLAVLLKDDVANQPESTERVKQLAKLFDAFCTENVSSLFTQSIVNGEVDLLSTDAAIEKHIKELREHEETSLPEDKETLVKFYDRLQQRKSRRMQRDFYASTTTDKLADLILRYLDEEIEAARALL